MVAVKEKWIYERYAGLQNNIDGSMGPERQTKIVRKEADKL